MRYGLLSDVHASPGPLRVALARLRAGGAERIVCLGDVVGYGPDPAAAIAMLVEARALVVRGNHDAAVGDEAVFADLNADAQAALRRHREVLGDGDKEWLELLPLVAREERFVFVHASLPEPARFRYLTLRGGTAQREPEVFVTVREMAAELAAEEIAFVGHSHVPAVYSLSRGGAFREELPARPVYRLGSGGAEAPRIVNVGSVALPRRGRPTAGLLDGDRGELRFLRL
jgi:predicted phosphodiesterase